MPRGFDEHCEVSNGSVLEGRADPAQEPEQVSCSDAERAAIPANLIHEASMSREAQAQCTNASAPGRRSRSAHSLSSIALRFRVVSGGTTSGTGTPNPSSGARSVSDPGSGRREASRFRQRGGSAPARGRFALTEPHARARCQDVSPHALASRRRAYRPPVARSRSASRGGSLRH